MKVGMKNFIVFAGIALCAFNAAAEWKMAAPFPIIEKSSASGTSQYSTLSTGATSGYGTLVTTNETATTPEIVELAKALQYDPLKMYEFVKNHIDYLPTYGVYTGAGGCLKAMKGNDFDQCALLASLLRISGYPCYFKNADVEYLRNDVAEWLPLPADELDGIHWNCGGSSGPITNDPTRMYVNRTWLMVEIDGNEVLFDPAIKHYTTNGGIDLVAATGYSLSALRTAASSNATVTTESVQNMNQSALEEMLTKYTTNLISYIKTNLSGDGVDEIFGLRKIVQEPVTNYSTALPFGGVEFSSSAVYWSHIPTNLVSVFRVQHVGIDKTFKGYELAGKRLSMVYDSSNGNRPLLYLDGTVCVTGTPTTAGQEYDLTVGVDVAAHASFPPGAFDDSATQSLVSGGEYVIVQDANTGSEKALQSANNNLRDALNAGLPSESEAVACGAFELAAWMYRMQDSALTEIIANQCGVAGYTLHLMGACGQSDSMHLDLPVGYGVAYSPDVDKRNKYFAVRSLMGSALEHGIFEQNQGKESVSAVRILRLNNEQGNKTFLADSNTWSSVKPQLTAYDAGFMVYIENAVTNGTTFVLPEDPSIQLNQWTGIGYVARTLQADGQRVSMIISGDYNGGVVSWVGKIVSKISSALSWTMDFFSSFVSPTYSIEPVDLFTGNYILDKTDLTVGNDPAPLGLKFSRSYSSGQKRIDHPLGFGWTHSLDMNVSELTRTDAAQGKRTPADAAAQMVYAMVASDLMDGNPDVLDWTIGIFATDWAMAQSTLNAAVVQLGKNSLEFIRQPDGSYTPPPRSTYSLSKSNGLFSLQERNGLTYSFNASNKVAAITNPDGKSMVFTYVDDTLTQVKDAYNRTLAFGYSGDRLTSVTDGGRTVSFMHDSSGNLTNVNDVASFNWGITYDGEHQIKTLTDPEDLITIQNFYNSLGQVTNQLSATSNPWNFLVGGFQATEEDPYGNQTTHYFDESGRNLGTMDALGNRTHQTYDAQGRLVLFVNEAGITNVFAYDSNHNLLSQTNALGTPEQVVSAFEYDAQNHLRFTTNAVGTAEQTITEYTYTEHKIDTITLAKGSMAAEVVTDYDYNPNGLLQQISEGNGARVTTHSNFDPYGHAQTTTSTDAGTVSRTFDIRGNLKSQTLDGKTTTFGYNALGQLVAATNALGTAEQTIVSRTYWKNGLLKTTTDARGKTSTTYWTDAYKQAGVVLPNTGSTTNIYDAVDRLVRSRDPEGNWATNTLDTVGRIVEATSSSLSITNQFNAVGSITNSVVDPSGLNLWTASAYDSLNRKTSATSALSAVHFHHDSLGRVTNRVNAASKDWKTEFDELGRVKKTIRPSGNYEEYGFDALGNRTHFWNAEGKPTTFGFDAQGRVTAITNAIDKVTEFSFDAAGNLSQRTAADLKVTDYGYNDLNRLVAITNEGAEVATFDHDPNGNIVEATSPSLSSCTFGYDSMNHLIASTQSVLSAQSAVQNQFDLNGNRTNIVYPGGLTVGYEFGADNRLESVTTKYANNTKTISFGYDTANRLTGVAYPNGVNSTFGHDAEGRITSIVHGTFVDRTIQRNALGFKETELIDAGLKPTVPNTGRRIKTHNTADQLTSEWVQQGTNEYTVSYDYSENGCLTNSVAPNSDSVSYTYDYDNRLSSASSASSAVEYLYDASGARIGRIAGGSPAVTNYFVIDYADGLKRPLAETDASGTVTRFYVWSGSQLLCHIEANGDVFYYHSDELGSTLALTNDDGDLTDEFAYMPYGYANHTPHAGSSDTPFLWLGGYGVYYDADTDLHLTLHRAYSSKLKRFIHPDPLGIDGGVNVYAMANMNPLWFIDPYGLEAMSSGARAGQKLRGAVNRSVEFTQNALKSIGNGVWSGTRFATEMAWKGVAWAAPRVWNLPNTVLGLAWGGLGYAAGALPGVQMPTASVDHNAIQFENHPLMSGAITMGNIISYAKGFGPGASIPEGTVGLHELQHTFQGQVLGPLYFPSHIIFGGAGLLFNQSWHGSANILETGPQSNPPTPWP